MLDLKQCRQSVFFPPTFEYLPTKMTQPGFLSETFPRTIGLPVSELSRACWYPLYCWYLKLEMHIPINEVYAAFFTSVVHSPRFHRTLVCVLDVLAATVSTCLCQLRSSLMVIPCLCQLRSSLMVMPRYFLLSTTSSV